MKKAIIGILLAAGISSVSAGSLSFALFGGGVNAPIFLEDGTTRAGNTIKATLYLDGQPTSFERNIQGNGLFTGITASFDGLSSGNFQIHFVDEADPLRVGFIDLGTVALTDPPAAPTALLQLNDVPVIPGGEGISSRQLYIVPEPSTIGLAVLGAGLFFFFRRRK